MRSLDAAQRAYDAQTPDDDPLWDDARDAAHATPFRLAREHAERLRFRLARRPTRDELLDALTDRHYAALCAARDEARTDYRRWRYA